MLKQTTKEIKTIEVIQIFNDILHRALVAAKEGIKTEVKIEFQVPSGADWSGMRLEIDTDNPLWITITTIETE